MTKVEPNPVTEAGPVQDQGLEGIVAKPLASKYQPGERRWSKVKNRDYWRYGQELEAMQNRRRASI